jgi:hypothetical protein
MTGRRPVERAVLLTSQIRRAEISGTSNIVEVANVTARQIIVDSSLIEPNILEAVKVCPGWLDPSVVR